MIHNDLLNTYFGHIDINKTAHLFSASLLYKCVGALDFLFWLSSLDFAFPRRDEEDLFLCNLFPRDLLYSDRSRRAASLDEASPLSRSCPPEFVQNSDELDSCKGDEPGICMKCSERTDMTVTLQFDQEKEE